MKIINWIKNFVGIKEPVKEIKKTKEIKKDERTEEEKILASGNELRIVNYYNQQAFKKGLTDTQLIIKHEKAIKEREKKNRKINFEFIPKNQANRNVRTFLEHKTGSYRTWQLIRNYEEEKAGCKCSICGLSSQDYDNTKTYHTECHEVWEYFYDEKNILVQKLVRLEALCIFCHNIKHLNQYSRDKEHFNGLLEIYSSLNNISKDKAFNEYKKHLNICYEKAENKYVLDLSYLKNYKYEEVLEGIDLDNYFNCHSDKFNSFIDEYKKENKTDTVDIDKNK